MCVCVCKKSGKTKTQTTDSKMMFCLYFKKTFEIKSKYHS